MCCLLTILIILGPRVAGVFWWLFDSDRWVSAAGAFNSFLWPLLGIIFLPWTTIIYVLVFRGGLSFWDWLFLVAGLIVDITSLGGGAFGNRDKLSRT